MMGKMVKNMTYFVVLLVVVLMSFGVTRQAILNPNAEPKFKILRDVRVERKYSGASRIPILFLVH